MLIVREKAQALASARRIEETGAEAVVAPIWRLIPLEPEGGFAERLVQALRGGADGDAVGGVLVTSANGVRALEYHLAQSEAREGAEEKEESAHWKDSLRHLPLFAVGPESAAAARAFGFAQVLEAGGNGASLAALVRERHAPIRPLLHLAGSATAAEPSRTLAGAGYRIVRLALYEMRPVPELPRAASEFLREAAEHGAKARTRPRFVAFESLRAAEVFMDLVDKAGLNAYCTPIVALVRSPAIAKRIRTQRNPDEKQPMRPSDSPSESVPPIIWKAVEIAPLDRLLPEPPAA